MRIRKHGSRGASRPDLFQNLAVRPLGKSAAAKFLRRRHSKNAMTRQAIDQMPRYVRLPIDRDRVEMFVEKLPDFGERFIQLRLLCRRDPRIRHRPVRNKTSEK